MVARKHKTPFVAPERVSLVSRPRPEASVDKNLNEGEEHIPPDDPVSFTKDGRSLLMIFKFDSKLSAIILSLRDRMRFYKLRVTPNATKIASTFNEQFKPEKIPEHNDYQTEWIDASCPDDILIGEKVYLQKSHPRLATRTQHKL